MARSTAPVSSLPYQISTSNDPTKIHKTAIAFRGQDFLSSAANWTKQKLFSNDGNGGVGGSMADLSPPIMNGNSSGTASPPGSSGSGVLKVDMNGDGLIVCVYTTCVQVWRYEPKSGGVLEFIGSTHSINGVVSDAKVINVGNVGSNSRSGSRSDSRDNDTNVTLIVQVVRSRNTHLEIHQLCYKPSLIHSLILPPASSGPGPYQIFTGLSSSYMAVVTSSGLVTLFSFKNYHPLALSGLEVAMAPDGTALLDLQGRWLALMPKPSNETSKSNGGRSRSSSNGSNTTTSTNRFDFLPNAHTPVNLPPSGPLYERMMESLSATAVTSLKSLSEAGYSGLKYYLSKDGSGDDQLYSTNGHGHAGPQPTFTSGPKSSLKLLGKLLFSDQSSTNLVQIIDIPTETSICCFSPLEGLSHISLSPYDATLLTVSTKGDHMYSYDISFVPKEITVTGRYARGKVPARIKRVAWDTRGGFGLVTYDRGSLHWFDKRLSFDTSTNKVWRLSNWGIEDIVFVNGRLIGMRYDDSSFRRSRLGSGSSDGSIGSGGNNGNKSSYDRESHLLLLKQGQIMIADPNSGQSIWKYDIPTVAIPDPYKIIKKSDEEIEEHLDSENDQYDNPGLEDQSGGSSSASSISISSQEDHGYFEKQSAVDPLSFFELETCLPYPFIHEDRRITISTTEYWEKSKFSEREHEHEHNDHHDLSSEPHFESTSWYPVMPVFGLDIPSIHIDFGKAKGEAKFTPSEDQSDVNIDDQIANGEGLRRAMESLVLSQPPVSPTNKATSLSPSVIINEEDDVLQACSIHNGAYDQ